MKKVFLCFFFCSLLIMGCQNKGAPKLKDGDLIFHTSTSSQSKAIQAATHSKYSHMGIIYRKDNQIYVFEAVQPVKLTPLEDWIKRGEGQHYVVKRLKNADKILTPAVIQKMKEEGYKYLGKSYDLYFEWSDERIYILFGIGLENIQKCSWYNWENSSGLENLIYPIQK